MLPFSSGGRKSVYKDLLIDAYRPVLRRPMICCLSRLRRMECDSLSWGSPGSPGWGSEPSLKVVWQWKGKVCANERIDINVQKVHEKTGDVPRWVETQLNRGLPLLGGHERFLKRALLFQLHKAKMGTTRRNIQFFRRHIFATNRLFL